MAAEAARYTPPRRGKPHMETAVHGPPGVSTMVMTRVGLSTAPQSPHPRVISDNKAGAGARSSTSMATSAVAASDMRAAMTVLEKESSSLLRRAIPGAPTSKLEPGQQHGTSGPRRMQSHTRSSRNLGNLCSIPSVISIPFSLIC
jgi:hypothetical protein